MTASDWMMFGATLVGPVIGALIVVFPLARQLDKANQKYAALAQMVNRELPIEVSKDGRDWVRLQPKRTT